MNKYKIIFLDIDGVMNSDQYNNYRYKLKTATFTKQNIYGIDNK